MDQSDHVRPEAQPEHRGAFLGGGGIDAFAFLDQRTNPIGLPSRREVAAQPGDDIGQFLVADDQRFDRGPSRRHLVDPADIHLAIDRQRQRPRDRGRGHHEQVRRALPVTLVAKPRALRDAEPVLLVDHDEPERSEPDTLGEQRVRPDQDVDLTGGEQREQ